MHITISCAAGMPPCQRADAAHVRQAHSSLGVANHADRRLPRVFIRYHVLPLARKAIHYPYRKFMYRRYPTNAYRLVYGAAALCLVVRSLVAPGLMVVGGSEGVTSLALVLCPNQNQALDFDRLSSGGGRHHHHRLSTPDDKQQNSDAAPDAGMHLASLDTGCGLWSASATAVSPIAPQELIGAIFGSRQPRFAVERVVQSLLTHTAQPRAPPLPA